jgi:hypothetical protein
MQASVRMHKKAERRKAGNHLSQRTKEPLCVRYAELLRLRQAVFEAESAKPTRDNRLDLRQSIVTSPHCYGSALASWDIDGSRSQH